MPQVLEFARPADFIPLFYGEADATSPSVWQEPPSMPSALLRLELLLKAPVTDLGAVCEAIRGDIGLSVGMLRLSNSEGDMPQRLQDLVLYQGRDELRIWVRERALLGTCRTVRAAMAELTRRCRRVARAAEVMAGFVSGLNREEAYFGALLHNLGSLPGHSRMAPHRS
jgi:c-di-GMP-related signal transduction protein